MPKPQPLILLPPSEGKATGGDGPAWTAGTMADRGLDPQPEFLLLGTGAAFAFAPKALRDALEARGIGIEAMDSKAAARAWGVLRSEERWIVAALMPLK